MSSLIEKMINLRHSTNPDECCFTCEYWYDHYYDASCKNEQIYELYDELSQQYGENWDDEWYEYTDSGDVCDLYTPEFKNIFKADKTFKLREWVKIIKGEHKGKIGEIIPGSSGVEGRVQIGNFTTDYLTYDYIEKITDPDNCIPFTNIKITLTKNEYNKLIEDHDKYCEKGECGSCSCGLGESINPKFDELCLYKFIEEI